jgi:hypothetical protein
MDQFQFVLDDAPAGPVRESWEQAATDAVSAGVAAWAHKLPFERRSAITWSILRAAITRIKTERDCDSESIHRRQTARRSTRHLMGQVEPS